MKKPIPTACEVCNGEGAENLVGQPEMCSACHDTGAYCPECPWCGIRSAFDEWPFSDVCRKCQPARALEDGDGSW